MLRIKFCSDCNNNMTNYQITKDDLGVDHLYYYCNSCKNQEEIENINKLEDAILYRNVEFKTNNEKIIRKDMADDKSLPLIESDCINPECPSKSKTYIRYMEYNSDGRIAYICCTCKYIWKK